MELGSIHYPIEIIMTSAVSPASEPNSQHLILKKAYWKRFLNELEYRLLHVQVMQKTIPDFQNLSVQLLCTTFQVVTTQTTFLV